MTEQYLKNLGLRNTIMNPNDHYENQYSLSDLLTEFAKQYHTEQLFIYGVVGSKTCKDTSQNILQELLDEHKLHEKNEEKERFKSIGKNEYNRKYFEAKAKKEAIKKAIEIFTGTEL